MSNIRKKGAFFVLFIALFSTGAFSASEGESEKNVRKLAMANNEFAFNLHRKLVSGSPENVFFSPFSVSSAFGMLFYGTRGATAKELRKVLGYEEAGLASDRVAESFNRYLSEVLKTVNSSDGYVLNSANDVLVAKRIDLLEDYRITVQNSFKAVVREVDFVNKAPQIVKEINDWVKEKTNGKIDKLLDQLDPSTILVLLNAVYFKGTWKTQFEPQRTSDEVFYNNGIEESSVEMMHTTSHFPYVSTADFQVIELPYKGDNVSMLIFLPNQMDGLAALEERLDPEELTNVQRRLSKTKVVVSLPKFKMQYETELSPQMKALGAHQIFNADSADFSGMTPSKNVKVSQVTHKAVIEVNEEGSEAAAATGIVMMMASAVVRNIEFKANHPFLFVIIEKGSYSNMILFLGRVNNL